MRRFALAFVIGCGGGGGGNQSLPPDAALPQATCDAVPLADTSAPTATVGDGTPGSCTAAALQTAVDGGGTIVFDCGSAPATITVTETINVTKETVLDGGGLVTLSGGDATRILYLDSDYNTATPRLTVQRLSFIAGKGPSTGDDTEQGGGAIYRDGGSLTVIDCHFEGNHATGVGQDIAGGAIYGFGGGETVIAGSTFSNNAASNGGAVGSLNGDVTIINTTLSDNAATGTDGNPGNGGCGGALYMDGRDEAASLCGVTMRANSAGAIGGAVFRVSNDSSGSFAIDRSTIDGNQVTAADGLAGGLYLQGLALTVGATTISRNQAGYNGGIWINACAVAMTNTTVAENVATASNGGGIWLGNDPTGAITNTTIANNHSTADGQIAGGIFGTGLTLVNTIVANNTAMYTPTCSDEHTDGSGNLQWPDGSPCTASPTIADPKLGELGDNGGPTETLAPAADSPARGLGSGCPDVDQRGTPRGSPCTAGAVEVP
jgi:hypothetical protein